MLHEMATKLNARYVRFDVYWNQAEPAQGAYAENAEKTGYLDNVVKAVDAARGEGLKVIIVTYRVPKWAAHIALLEQQPLWPWRTATGTPTTTRPPPPASPRSASSATHLSALLTGKVVAYEPWNEPNLWVYLYPQTYGGDDAYAVHRYAAMLKAFHDGVAIADPGALIVGADRRSAGETKARARMSENTFNPGPTPDSVRPNSVPKRPSSRGCYTKRRPTTRWRSPGSRNGGRFGECSPPRSQELLSRMEGQEAVGEECPLKKKALSDDQ